MFGIWQQNFKPEFDVKSLFPDGNYKRFKRFQNFLLFAFCTDFGGISLHEPNEKNNFTLAWAEWKGNCILTAASILES